MSYLVWSQDMWKEENQTAGPCNESHFSPKGICQLRHRSQETKIQSRASDWLIRQGLEIKSYHNVRKSQNTKGRRPRCTERSTLINSKAPIQMCLTLIGLRWLNQDCWFKSLHRSKQKPWMTEDNIIWKCK